MIAYLKGRVALKAPTTVVLDVQDVGYRIFIPLSTYDCLPETGMPCRLWIHDHVREDAHQLFGFAEEAERDMFEMLIEVTGIGPRVALNLLSGLPVGALRAAIAEGDVKRLSRAQGIGRKTAERIVLELRDRIDPLEGCLAGPDSGGAGDAPGVRDALMALAALGFSPEQARNRIQPLLNDPDGRSADTETLIKRALAGR